MDERYLAKYLRISEDDDEAGAGKRESDSIANQRKLLDAYIADCEELSQYKAREFIDDGVSGVNFHRPAVQRMLNEVRKGRVSCIVVKDLSRFGRNYIEVGDYIEQIFPFLGVRFISVSDHFDSRKNAVGIEIGFKNLIHDLYSRDLSEKVKSAVSIRQKQGSYNGGGIPYGYKLGEGKEGTFVPDGEAAEIVRRIFCMAAEGNTTFAIAARLNEEAIPTPGMYKKQHGGISYSFKNEKRNLWTALQVNIIIRNEVYRGTYVAHKLSTVKPGVVRKNKESEYITLDNHHESLVEEELFQKAQAAIKQRGKTGRRTEYESALKGKVKCGYCGYSMSVRREAKEPYYRCWTGKGCGSYMKINVMHLENTVREILQKYLEVCSEQEKRKRNERMQALSNVSRVKEEICLLEIQAEHCTVTRMDAYYQWKEGKFTKEEYIKKKEELSAREKEYKKELQRLAQCLEEAVSVGEGIGASMGMERFSRECGLTQELVDELVERIEVFADDRIEMKWKVRDEIQ